MKGAKQTALNAKRSAGTSVPVVVEPAGAFLVGHEFMDGKWPRETVAQKAQEAGLDVVAITGGRLSHVEEFRRSVRLVEREGKARVTSLPLNVNGVQLELTLVTTLSCMSVDGQRQGNTYQLDRRVKYNARDVERECEIQGVNKKDVMGALGTTLDTDHEITQSLGKWRLLDDLTIEATSYGLQQPEANERFALATKALRDAYRKMTSMYTHQDLKNGWVRARTTMQGAFPLRFGAGGTTFVPGVHAETVLAWKRFCDSLYGEPIFDVLPLASDEVTRRLVSQRATEWYTMTLNGILNDALVEGERVLQRVPARAETGLVRLEQRVRREIERLRVEAEASRAFVAPFGVTGGVSVQTHDRMVQAPRQLKEALRNVGILNWEVA